MPDPRADTRIDTAPAMSEARRFQQLKASSTILTTNVSIADWASAFGDATVAAMLDRLLHRAAVVGIDGPSYRLRAHQHTVDNLRAGVNALVS
ncbi:ATP-binding protein [Pseudonocardia sp.]|uniref:ATP-binding protein n=1 Tax=Pseudonocardia sp. TaxID=60912 RepID=UPI003D0FACA7